MTGNLLRATGVAGRLCVFAGLLTFLTGCGFKLAGPGETVSIPALTSEDLHGPCKFDLNMPDQPLATLGLSTSEPAPTEVAALVVYERGDSSKLFNDSQIQSMAADLHMVTVFARQCDAETTGDIQADATQGQGRALFAALTQYAADSRHPEIANLGVVLSGFSAAGVLATTMTKAFPNRVLGFIPYASGSAEVDLNSVEVTSAMAQIPALVLANAYDPESGVQPSLRLFNRGWQQGAPWGFGVQNNTGHCCTLSIRDLMVPWVTALMQPLQIAQPIQPVQDSTMQQGVKQSQRWAQQSANSTMVRFLCYTDGFYGADGEVNCWIPSASILPNQDGGPQLGWLPDSATADAWLKWVLSPGTN